VLENEMISQKHDKNMQYLFHFFPFSFAIRHTFD